MLRERLLSLFLIALTASRGSAQGAHRASGRIVDRAGRAVSSARLRVEALEK